jgi:hypothetical protein
MAESRAGLEAARALMPIASLVANYPSSPTSLNRSGGLRFAYRLPGPKIEPQPGMPLESAAVCAATPGRVVAGGSAGGSGDELAGFCVKELDGDRRPAAPGLALVSWAEDMTGDCLQIPKVRSAVLALPNPRSRCCPGPAVGRRSGDRPAVRLMHAGVGRVQRALDVEHVALDVGGQPGCIALVIIAEQFDTRWPPLGCRAPAGPACVHCRATLLSPVVWVCPWHAWCR